MTNHTGRFLYLQMYKGELREGFPLCRQGRLDHHAPSPVCLPLI